MGRRLLLGNGSADAQPRGLQLTKGPPITEILARGLAGALSIYATGTPERLEKTLRAIGQPAQDLSAIAKSLISELRRGEEKFLVIDDYQTLAGSSAERIIEALSHSGELRLVICSRILPGWANARRHIYGEVFELHRDDLAFEDSEAAELLTEIPESRDVINRAHGWPAVIGLAAFAGAPGAPKRQTISHTLYDFLTDESYNNALPETQHALLDMALLPSVNRDTLTEIFGIHSEEIVADAARTGLLAVSRHSIELHPLAKEFLRQKLRRTPLAADRVRGAVGYAIAQGAWDEAFALVEEFCLYDQLEQLISSSFSALLATGHVDTLARFNRHANAALEESTAVMSLVDAEVAFRDGFLARAEDLALSAAIELPPSHPLKSRGYVLAGTAAVVAFDVERSLRLHSQGLDFGPERRDRSDALWGQCLALIYLEDGRCHEAARNLRHVGYITPEAKLQAATARLLVSRLSEGFLGFDGTLVTGDVLDDVGDPRTRTSFGNVCSYVLALRGRYDEARVVIDTALADAEVHHLAFAKPHLHWTRAMVGLGLRQFTAADTHLRVVESAVEATGDHHLELNARTLRARVLLAQNRPDDAIAITSLEWDSVPTKAMYGEYLATRALALAVANERAEARRLIRKARRLTSVVEVQTLAATASAIVALDTPAARTMVERALKVAASLDTWDALLCGIRAVPSLLDALPADSHNRRHLLGVLRGSHDHALLKLAGFPTERRYGKAGLLSQREREVADLLCQGLTNKEIARMLYISDATAKVHVRHILNKLGARTRTEAVALYMPNEDKAAVSDSGSSSASRA